MGVKRLLSGLEMWVFFVGLLVRSMIGQVAAACDPGKYKAAEGCFDCPHGSYSMGGPATVCFSCMAGTFASSTGSTTCERCGVGTISDSSGLSACLPCGTGTYQYSTGSTRCFVCEAGSFQSSPRGTACDACPPGTKQKTVGQSACVECAAGSYSWSARATDCALCEAGSFQPSEHATGCLSCKAGSFQPAKGASACVLCAEGTHLSAEGAIKCVQCEPGSFQSTPGSSACLSCLPGKHQPLHGSSECIACEKGTFATAGGLSSRVCTGCPGGTFGSATGSSSPDQGCLPCAAGRYSTAQALQTADQCLECPTGTYSPVEGQSVCVLCSSHDNSYCPGGTDSPLPCGKSLLCNGTHLDADTGFLPYYDGNTTIWAIPCPKGTLCAQAGSNAEKGLLPPWPQQVHFVVFASGESKRVDWPWLVSSDYRDAVFWLAPEECPMGFFLLADACAPCINGTFGTRPGGLASDVCVACPAGTFAGHPGAALCRPCPVGSFTPYAGMSVCTSCPPGQFQSNEGSAVCQECVAGRYSPGQGASVCLECPAGMAQPIGGAASCTGCDLSTEYSAEGDTRCLVCGVTPADLDPAYNACAVQPAPDESKIWVAVRGDEKHDNCLLMANSTRESVHVIALTANARCRHELRVLGRPELQKSWTGLFNAREALDFVVRSFNATFYPEWCRLGRAVFGVAHTGAQEPFGANRIMIVTDTRSKHLLFEAPCEGVWGVCKVSGFCPEVDVTVRVCVQDEAGDILAEDSTKVLVEGHVACPPVPASSWTLWLRLKNPGIPYFPGDTLQLSWGLENAPTHLLAFRLMFRIHPGFAFIAANMTMPVLMEHTSEEVSPSEPSDGFGDASGIPQVVWMKGDVSSWPDVQTELGHMDLRVKTMGRFQGIVAAVLVDQADFMLIQGSWLSVPVMGEGFSCAYSDLKVVLDHRRVTSVAAGLHHDHLVHWKSVSEKAGVWGTAVEFVKAVWNTGEGPLEIQEQAICQSLTPTVLTVENCKWIWPRGSGTGRVLVTFDKASVVVSVSVLQPSSLTTTLLPDESGMRARVLVETTLLDFRVNVASLVLATAEESVLFGDELICEHAGTFTLGSVLTWKCPFHTHKTGPSLFLLSGSWDNSGSFMLKPSILQPSSDIVDVLGPLGLQSLDPLRAALAPTGNALHLVREGGSARCVALKDSLGTLWKIPVFPPAPASLKVELSHSSLVVRQDMWQLVPSVTGIRNGLLCFSDGVCNDVTNDPRLTITGVDSHILKVLGDARSIQTVSDDGMAFVFFSFSGMPCLQARFSVQVFHSSVANTFLRCPSCPSRMAAWDDPLCVEWPELFACNVRASSFKLQRILVDGTEREDSAADNLKLGGVAVQAGDLVVGDETGELVISNVFAPNEVTIEIVARWAVSAKLMCNEETCDDETLRLTSAGNVASLEPFSYSSSLHLGLVVALCNGSILSLPVKPKSVQLLVNETVHENDGMFIPLTSVGRLTLRVLFGMEWGFSNMTVVLHVHGLSALRLEAPSVLYQVHCTRLWEQGQISLIANITDGTVMNVIRYSKLEAAGVIFVEQGDRLGAVGSGMGFLLAEIGGTALTVTVTAIIESRLFRSVEVDALPESWNARLGEGYPLHVRPSPPIPTFNASLVLDRSVRWAAAVEGVVRFADDSMYLLSDYYQPLSLSCVLRSCQGSDPVVVRQDVQVNVIPSQEGQVDFGDETGLPCKGRDVGTELEIPIYLFTSFPLLSFDGRIVIAGLQPVACSPGELPFSVCNLHGTRGTFAAAMSGSYVASQRTGRVLLAIVRGRVELITLVRMQVYVQHAKILGHPEVLDKTHEFTVRLGPGQTPLHSLLPTVSSIYSGPPKRTYVVNAETWKSGPDSFKACCDVVVTFPGGVLPFPSVFRVEEMYLVQNASYRSELSLADPRLRVEYDRYLLSVDVETGTWKVKVGAKGVTDIQIVYVQPGSLLESRDAAVIRVVFAEAEKVLLTPGQVILKRLHCSPTRFQLARLQAFVVLRFEGGTHMITAELKSACRVLRLIQEGMLVEGLATGLCRVHGHAFGLSAQVEVSVVDDSVFLNAIVLEDPYVLSGQRGETQNVRLVGRFEGDELMQDVGFLLSAVHIDGDSASPMGSDRLTLLDNSQPMIPSRISVFILNTCCPGLTLNASSSLVVQIRAALSFLHQADLLVVPSVTGFNATIVSYGPLAAFIVQVWTDAEELQECKQGPLFSASDTLGKFYCTPNYPTAGSLVLSGVFANPVDTNRSVAFSVEPMPLQMQGWLELSGVHGSSRTTIVAGRFNASTPRMDSGSLPVVDASTLSKQYYAAVVQPSLMPALEQTVRIIAGQEPVILDSAVYSNDQELSVMVRIMDRFLRPCLGASVTIFIDSQKLGLGSQLQAEYVQDGWYAWQRMASVPLEEGVRFSYIAAVHENSSWGGVGNLSYSIGKPMHKCPWIASDRALFRVEYVVTTRSVLPGDLQAFVACLVKVVQRRVQSKMTGFSVELESFIRVEQAHEAIMRVIPIFLGKNRRGTDSKNETLLQRIGIHYINDTADPPMPCPFGMYYTENGTYEPLPLHAMVGPDCYGMECVKGYVLSGRSCVPVSVPVDLAWVCLVVLGVLVLLIFCVLCALYVSKQRQARNLPEVDLTSNACSEPPFPDDNLDFLKTSYVLDDYSSSLLDDDFSCIPIHPVEEDKPH